MNENSRELIQIEYSQDDIYYWLVFTVFFSSLSLIGAVLFVSTYTYMVYLRRKRLEEKGCQEYGLKKNFDNTNHDLVKHF